MTAIFSMTPLRAEILRHLSISGGGVTSGDIGRALSVNYRTVGRHLALLEELGIVEANATEQRQGVHVRYRLNTENMKSAERALAKYLHGK
nr:transcriptional regulator, ArsR family [Arthrobacter sp.]